MQTQAYGDQIFGGVIAAGSVLALVMVMHHPVVPHHDTAELVQGIGRQAAMDRAVHGVLAVIATLTTSAMVWWSARSGVARRPHLLVAAVANGLALALTCFAVLLDGFVAPALAERCSRPAIGCAASVADLLLMGAVQIEYLTRFALVATAAATLLLSGDLLLRRDGARVIGLLGMASALCQLWLLFASAARLTPHSLALVLVVQALWNLPAGVLMASRRGPFAGSA
jgi:hypothetical protein